MTLYEAHRNFDIELDKSTGISSYPSFLPEEKDYWINSYIEIFVKTRYSGLNTYRTGFQQSQKRSDDLRTLVTTFEYNIVRYNESDTYSKGQYVYEVTDSDGKYVFNGYKRPTEDNTNDSNQTGSWSDWKTVMANGPDASWKCVFFDYPSDYFIGVGENVTMLSEDNKTFMSDVSEATVENIDSKLLNSLSEHLLHNGTAKPLRLYSNGRIELYTTSSYGILKYKITYIKNPDKVDYYKYPEFLATNSYVVGDMVLYNGHHYVCVADSNKIAFSLLKFNEIKLTFMPEHTWSEIMVGAVRMALENISEPRYQTYSQEAQAIE